MTKPALVPPIKCQGIKTKLIPDIKNLITRQTYDRWVEPFCGSCVVPLNLQPAKALLADTNRHIIQLYQDIQSWVVTPGGVKEFLTENGEKLRSCGEDYYYEVRERFNHTPNSYDFLFLNRACFNGVMRFNRKGYFNVPFCRKDNRFAQAYVTKITNQVRALAAVIHANDWEFVTADFRTTLALVKPNDFVYADPPYTGRHVDYFNSWSEEDENELVDRLQKLPCRFMLSTWHSNEFRQNPLLEKNWTVSGYHLFTKEHYYHVGSHEELRHAMLEALITNFSAFMYQAPKNDYVQLSLLERRFKEYVTEESISGVS